MAAEISESLCQRFQAVRLLVLDVDGVLTDGSITYTSTGDELKTFNVKDGQGLSYWNQRPERSTAIITARKSPMVNQRAKDCGITHIQQGIKPKLPALDALVAELNLPWEAVAYMGDDWPDVACLQKVGLAICPADAVADVAAVCHWQATACGGKGAVRELITHLLSTQGLAPNFA